MTFFKFTQIIVSTVSYKLPIAFSILTEKLLLFILL